ncbi:MAG: response regulator [Proteobacteria bacterium]|nr:response regulator [Pseudomonadota bacterium]
MSETLRPVLILDDEERVRELLMDYLGEFDGFDLFGAGSGEEALEILRQRPATLCVVDMRLPGMDGAEFIESAAAERLCHHFVVHTGSMDFSLSQALKDLGMVQEDVFFKPVDAAVILARIRELIKDEV